MAGTVAAVVLIIIFTYLIDWVGDFWSQVIYFVAIFGGILAFASRGRREDTNDPSRLPETLPRSLPRACPGRSSPPRRSACSASR